MRSIHIRSLLLLGTAALVGCYSEEGINHVDLTGTVRIPKEAAQVEMSDGDEVWTIDDPRAIGPVYVGVFSGMDATLEDYPHPEIGPVIDGKVNRSRRSSKSGRRRVGRCPRPCSRW